MARLTEDQQALVRNRKIGFVFQSFNLIPRTTALANVELPLAYAHLRRAERRRAGRPRAGPGRAWPTGPTTSRTSCPAASSSGSRSPARWSPRRAILLADEPTGNLDAHSTDEVLGILDQLNADGRTIVLITHEHDVAAHAKRLIRLVDGRIVADEVTR